jgi:poly-gamma-glutamate synthesis protein (capsule biosynthesis protein)
VAAAVLVGAALLAARGLAGAGGPRTHLGHGGAKAPSAAANPRLNPDYDGDGKPDTLVFGGDVNFPGGSVLAGRLAADPSTALGAGAKQLLGHSNLSMVNLETALTFGVCPVPQPKQFVFWAPPSALTALRDAGATLTTEANNHGEDCGEPGLLQSLTIRARKHYTVLGIGRDAHQAFTSYQTVLNGEHIGILAATQVIDADLVSTWTATSTQPGLASAYEVNELIHAVQVARRIDDTVIVFLHWGVQLDPCPDPYQEPLAAALVRAGADIVIGSHAHVLLGAGYLGTALVDYGLGNFAFYNDPVPTNYTGSLVVTITGRHVDGYSWRPAVEEDEVPVPASGAEAHAIQARWVGARACTNLTAHPTRPLASSGTESSPAGASLLALLSSY